MADAVPEFAQSLRCNVAERVFLRLLVAETCTLHLLGGSCESSGAYIVHFKEAECLGKRHPVSSGLQELNLCRHFPKHGIQTHFGHRSVTDKAL